MMTVFISCPIKYEMALQWLHTPMAVALKHNNQITMRVADRKFNGYSNFVIGVGFFCAVHSGQ